MSRIDKIRDIVFSMDDRHCFIERELILGRLEKDMCECNGKDKYALMLSRLLCEVSTPIYDCDVIGGRVVEGDLPEGTATWTKALVSRGHMNFNYELILEIGMRGILEKITEAADKKGDPDSLEFAKNAKIVVSAVKAFSERYSIAAREKGFHEMADALEKVPYEGAYDLFSALQSVWILHMIASCYVGSRDYAFGRFDEYMLPYYKKSLANGASEDELIDLVAHFLMKTNEICGRASPEYNQKPIPCFSSKQYINIGGETPNEFSKAVLKAAMINNMAQPQIVVLLSKDTDKDFEALVFEALSVLTDKMNVYNYDIIKKGLINKGLPESVAKDHSFSACCTLDLNYHTHRREIFTEAPQIFVRLLRKKSYASIDGILKEFTHDMCRHISDLVQKRQLADPMAYKHFVFDSIFLTDSAFECQYPDSGKSPYNLINVFCPGIATIGDSLMVIDKLVFKEKLYSYDEFIDIVSKNYEDHEKLRLNIKKLVQFGNDSDADIYTAMAGNAFACAVEYIKLKDNFYTVGGFYCLDRDNSWKEKVPATPNGRRDFEPFSENQSPTYGADVSGVTALLKSVAKLPFDRAFSGGLNVSFSGNVRPDILSALVRSYFALGGLHIGISVLDKDVLRDAMVNPERYKSLTVRLYGFSDYFINMSEEQQLAIISRTANKI
ncbi:MAG: hypothetical protein E7626_04770 [Ruminococcaceae bacterium]|nr:hypothetical protein [Oscillospiraceae bacterium]